MSFTDYSAFRQSVSTWLDVSDLTTAQVDDVIRVGEAKANRNLRVRLMESTTLLTISSGTATVPSDYLEAKHAYITSSPLRKLERRTVEWIYLTYPSGSSGNELYYGREGSSFIFGPTGTNGNQMRLTYYAEPASLAGTATINSVFSGYPEVYLMAALSEAEPFIGRDSRIELWEKKFIETLARANIEDKREGNSGSNLAVRTA